MIFVYKYCNGSLLLPPQLTGDINDDTEIAFFETSERLVEPLQLFN